MYKCECGREFEKRQSFIGHCGHCKVHLDPERFSRRLEIYRKFPDYQKDSIELRKQVKIDNDKKDSERWVSEQHKCEYCGKIMTSKFASGRFCSRSCSNGYVSSNQSEDVIKRKTRNTGPNLEKGQKMSSILTDESKYKLSKSLKLYYKTHESKLKGVKFTEEHKRNLSIGIKRAIEQRGARPGYLSKGRTKNSYPEEYWSNVLTNANINFIREYKIIKSENNISGHGCYFFDFYLPECNVDLEIDGSQHFTSTKQINSDKIRNNNIINAGFIVYRIRWKSPKKYHNEVVDDINTFINWYNKLINDKTFIPNKLTIIDWN